MILFSSVVSSTPASFMSSGTAAASNSSKKQLPFRDSQLKRSHVHSKSGISIQVRHGDLTTEPVDCIVSAYDL